MSTDRQQLPFAGARLAPRARADATRNRTRILAAAERLFAQRAAGDVSMDEVAAAAGVGKGTLYRRFGDQAGLAHALLDERERAMQDAVLSGPPPLGPGAPPAERLVAFLDALADVLEAHLDLHVLAERGAPAGRAGGPPYDFWRLHVLVLLREADAGLDADWFADALLAPLAPTLYRHQRRDGGMTAERVKAGLAALVERVLGAARR